MSGIGDLHTTGLEYSNMDKGINSVINNGGRFPASYDLKLDQDAACPFPKEFGRNLSNGYSSLLCCKIKCAAKARYFVVIGKGIKAAGTEEVTVQDSYYLYDPEHYLYDPERDIIIEETVFDFIHDLGVGNRYYIVT